MKFDEIKSVILTNKTILLDVSHAREAGDDDYSAGGIAMGKVLVSEIPSYGTVVAFDPVLEANGLKIGALVPISNPGMLRIFHWPNKPKAHKIVAIRFEAIDGLIEI